MNRVKTMWESFSCDVIPPDAPEEQYLGMRRAFYAGAQGLLAVFWEIGDKAVSEDAGAKVLEEMAAELRRFADDVKNGRA